MRNKSFFKQIENEISVSDIREKETNYVIKIIEHDDFYYFNGIEDGVIKMNKNEGIIYGSLDAAKEVERVLEENRLNTVIVPYGEVYFNFHE